LIDVRRRRKRHVRGLSTGLKIPRTSLCM
jgi:hypothetical protein